MPLPRTRGAHESIPGPTACARSHEPPCETHFICRDGTDVPRQRRRRRSTLNGVNQLSYGPGYVKAEKPAPSGSQDEQADNRSQLDDGRRRAHPSQILDTLEGPVSLAAFRVGRYADWTAAWRKCRPRWHYADRSESAATRCRTLGTPV